MGKRQVRCGCEVDSGEEQQDEEDDCNRVLCILNLDEVDCGLWTVWRGATGCFAHPEG